MSRLLNPRFLLSIAVLFYCAVVTAQTLPARPAGSVMDPSNPLSGNLVGLYVMNEGTGTFDTNLVDGQQANFTGTAPKWNTSDPSIVFPGGSALASYLSSGSDPAYFDLAQTPLTVVAKVYVPAFSANMGIAEKLDNNAGFAFGFDSSGDLRVGVWTPGSSLLDNSTGSNVVPTGQWTQVAFVWNGSTNSGLQIYVNGVSQSFTTASKTNPSNGTQGLHIGTAIFETSGTLNGRMAYLAIYQNRLLTATQLTQLDQQLPITLDSVSSTTENGTPTTVTNTSGRDAQVSFTGWSGQVMTVQLSNNSIGAVNASLIAPDGSTLASQASSASAFTLGTATLTLNGTYSVLVHPTAGGSGSITVSVAGQKDVRSPGAVIDPSNPLSGDLVGLYVMNEGTGTFDTNLVDGQQANFAGTSPKWNTTDPSLVFPGGSALASYLSAVDPAYFDLEQTPITVVAKIYVPAIPGNMGIVEKYDINNGFSFGINSSGELRFAVWNPNTYTYNYTASNAVPTGQWNQVAFVWNGSTNSGLQIYVNGVLQSFSTGTQNTIGTSTQILHIGSANFETPGTLNGRMAYLAIYQNRLLTATQLTQLDQQLPVALDAVNSIDENGTATTVTTHNSGQDAQVTFTGWAGQVLTVELSNNSIGAVNASLIAPDGTTLASQASSASAFNLPPATLALNGTYRVLVHPTAGGSGSITVSVVGHKDVRSPGMVLDRSNPLTQGLVGLYVMGEGSGNTDTNLVDGYPATFSGSTLPTWNTTDPSISFPGGGSLASYLDGGADPNFQNLSQATLTVVAKIFLPSTPTSTMALVEKDDNNHGFSFFIYGSSTLHILEWANSNDAECYTGSNAIKPGQWQQVAFVTTPGQSPQIFVNGVSQTFQCNGGGFAAGSSVQDLRIGSGSYNTPGTLSGKIAYVAIYQGVGLTSAQLTQLDQQLPISADVSAATIENGSPVTMTTSNTSQNIQVPFTGWKAQPVTVELSNNTIGAVNVSLIAPDGSTVTSQSSANSAFNLPSATLPLNGTYDVLIQPSSGTTGDIAVTVAGQRGVRAGNAVLDESNGLSPYLIGLFQMNEGAGTTDTNLVDGQQLTFSGTTPPSWNVSDPSVVFNGGASLSSYLDGGSNPLFNSLVMNKVSVAAKVRPSIMSAAGGIAEKIDGTSGFSFGYDVNFSLRVMVWKSGSWILGYTGNNAVVADQWQQVAFEWDGTVWNSSTIHIYVNGVALSLTTEGGGSPPSFSAQDLHIGNDAGDGNVNASLNGRLAYTAIYRGRLLTTMELGQLDAQLPLDTIDFAGTVTSSAPAPVNITSPGQNARMLFNGTAGQLLTPWFSSSNLGSLTAKLLNVDGTLLSTTTSSAEAFAPTQITAPTTGVYAAYLQTNGSSTGSLNVTLAPPSAPSVAIASPTGGSTVYLSAPAALTASAASTNGASVAQVQYFEGQNLLGTAVTAPYTLILGTPSTGSHTYTAQVMDSFGVSSQSAPVTVTWADPQISGFTPGSGPVGTQVTINGIGFGASQGSSVLTFNSSPATSIVSWSNQQIVALVPVTAITGPVVVTNNVVTTAPGNFTVPAPAITTYTPEGGNVGTQVTITGSYFQANQRNSTVTFNGTSAPVVSWSDTQIVCTVPSGGSTGSLTVNVNGVSSNSRWFELPNPVISSVTPASVPRGGTITIAGSGFGDFSAYSPDGNSTVNVGFVNVNGANAGGLVWSSTSITAVLPSNIGVGAGSLTVTNWDATSAAFPITITDLPNITGVSPTNGDINSNVTITGTNFGPSQGASTVLFWPQVSAQIVSWSDTQIVATVPPGTNTGALQVNIDGVASNTVNFILGSTTTVTDSLGNVTTYVSAALGGQWVNFSANGSGCSTCTVRGTIANVFDNSGDLLNHTDELGHVTTYTWDGNFNMGSQSQQLDSTHTVATSYTYNSFSEPLTVTDPLGNVTTNTYDGNGNLLTVTAPAPNGNTAASVTKFGYNTLGQLTSITDPLGNQTTLAYNPVGLIASITDAQQNVTSYGYDQRGNRTSVTDAANNQTSFAYDAGDRLTGITYPDQSTVGFGYDYRGRRTSVTDQNSRTTSYTYDDADRLISVTDAANNVTQYSYDTENNLLSITDANNNVTQFGYDAFGRVTQTTFPSTKKESYQYDAAGNLVLKTDRNGNAILYVYDALNRLMEKSYPDSSEVDYVYDLAGKIKQVADPTGTYAMAYDNMGRLTGTTTTYTFLPSLQFNNTYAYDANSNRTGLTLPDSSTDTYQYDTLNRLTSITDSLTGQFTFGYDGLSRRTSLTRPNGVNTSYGYDSLSHLMSVLHQNGTNTLDGANYTYDLAGNRASKSNLLNGITEQYTYDPLYQLTQAVQGATTTESYSYDPVGNRLSSVGMSYSYNSSNELTGTSAATYTYDANGNTLTKANSVGTTQYSWDFENRLISAVVPGVGTVFFKYDPFGRRIQKSGPNGTTNYVYDGANAIEEVDGLGNLLAHYAQGAGIDESLSELRSGTVGFYEADGLRSISSLSGLTGAISNSYAYDTFGNATALNGSFFSPYQYTGRDYDSETGLQYSRARYYDPSLGRFLSEDPLRFGGGANFYSYVLNDPTNLADPAGLCSPKKPQHCFLNIAIASDFSFANTIIEQRINAVFSGTEDPDGNTISVSFDFQGTPDNTLHLLSSPPPSDENGQQHVGDAKGGVPKVYPISFLGLEQTYGAQGIANAIGTIGAHELYHSLTGRGDGDYSPATQNADLMRIDSAVEQGVDVWPDLTNAQIQGFGKFNPAELARLFAKCRMLHPKKN